MIATMLSAIAFSMQVSGVTPLDNRLNADLCLCTDVNRDSGYICEVQSMPTPSGIQNYVALLDLENRNVVHQDSRVDVGCFVEYEDN